MKLTYRLEIRGSLPRVAGEELRRRFYDVEVRWDGAQTVVSGRADQAALRAVLSLLWDVGCEVRLVRVISRSGEEMRESSHDPS